MATRSAQSIRSSAEAGAWLEGLIDRERSGDWSYERLSLAPVEALLERLGNPERDLAVIHIAGSKGKGSTALFCEAILREAGFRVGTFTSPHLQRWSERFRVDGEEVSEVQLVRAVEGLRFHVEDLRSKAGPTPSFFDATTAAAWLIFAEAEVDYAVVEVGLGGRLDSTNAVQPVVTCVTSIELEHTERLGDTLAAIASEKAGILKPGIPVVVGSLHAEAMRVVEDRAAALDAPLARLGVEIELDVQAQGLGGSSFQVRDGPVDVRVQTPLLGVHPPHNAALAIACVRRLMTPGLSADRLQDAARGGIRGTCLPARLEVLGRDPWVLVDAAHTPASVEALTRVIDGIGGSARLVVSISSDKDVGALLDLLLPRACQLTLTCAEPSRSLDPAQLAAIVRGRTSELPLAVISDPPSALRSAAQGMDSSDVLCAVGSVYLAGVARPVLCDLVDSGQLGAARQRGSSVVPS